MARDLRNTLLFPEAEGDADSIVAVSGHEVRHGEEPVIDQSDPIPLGG
jgi:hypothetical protein